MMYISFNLLHCILPENKDPFISYYIDIFWKQNAWENRRGKNSSILFMLQVDEQGISQEDEYSDRVVKKNRNRITNQSSTTFHKCFAYNHPNFHKKVGRWVQTLERWVFSFTSKSSAIEDTHHTHIKITIIHNNNNTKK